MITLREYGVPNQEEVRCVFSIQGIQSSSGT